MGDAVSTLLFQPPTPSKLKQNKIVWLTTSKGTKIPAFYISYRRQGGVESCRSLTAAEIKDSSPQEGITILYSHANAEDLGSIYPWCKFLSKMLHVNLFAYDYTGYGMAFDSGTSKPFFPELECQILCVLSVLILTPFALSLQVRRQKNIATVISKQRTIICEMY